jgi:transposase
MVLDGDNPADVADFLNVSERSVWRWLSRWRTRGRLGDAALAVHPGRGRPAKLTGLQARQVVHWVKHDSPCNFGFITERWTARRVAAVIEERFGVAMNQRYLNRWLRWRGITPQIPPRVPRERNDALVASWCHHTWPGIKKKPPTAVQRLFSPMKAASFCSRW